MSAREGLYAKIYLGTVCPAGTADLVAVLTGVELSWSQSNTQWRPMGSLVAEDVLRGPLNWEGSFKKAYVNNTYLGSFNVGTVVYCGSICPRGTAPPAILGSLVLTGGSLGPMETENEAAVEEEHTFMLYNLTFG